MTKSAIMSCAAYGALVLTVAAIVSMPASIAPMSAADASPDSAPRTVRNERRHLPAAFARPDDGRSARDGWHEAADPGAAASEPTTRGHVTPRREAELRAPFQERLASVEVAEGDRVTKGQLLVTLDDQMQSVVVEAARLRAASEAAIERAKLELEDAEIDLGVMLRVFDDNGAIGEEVRKAELTVAQARVALVDAREKYAVAQVDLALEQRRLERHRILAPFDGIIISIDAEAGEMPVGDETILRLVDLDTLEAEMDVPVEMYGRFVVGQSYTLMAEAPVHRELEATLRSVSPVIDTASHTFRCVFTIGNEKGRLPSGFTVYLPGAKEESFASDPAEAGSIVVAPEDGRP